MAKYTKKSKIKAEVSRLEITPHSSSMALGGVRTGARTLALRRFHMTNSKLNPKSSSPSSSCYLELRNRRLQRPPRVPIKPRNQFPHPKQSSGESHNFQSCPKDERSRISPASLEPAVDSDSAAFASLSREEMQGSCGGKFGKPTGVNESLTDVGASEESHGGEKNLKSHEQSDRQRCSLPTAHEIEEFFAFAEQEQKTLFTEKYNFDVLTDMPLSGRFEWVQVHP